MIDMSRFVRAFALAGLFGASLFGLGACNHTSKRATLAYVERPVETIYNRAYDLMIRQRWEQAALQFDEVQRQHPYSEWARRSMLMVAYVHYRTADYDEAIASARSYIALFPGGQEAPYAYYLTGISYFEQILDVERSSENAENAMKALTELTRRYPNSSYARDAELKIALVADSLAGAIMNIGRYYMRREKYLAAINRFQSVVRLYGTTPQAPEALHRLVELNLAIGLAGEARTAAALLRYNFPDSLWAKIAYDLLAASADTQTAAN